MKNVIQPCTAREKWPVFFIYPDSVRSGRSVTGSWIS